MADRKVYVEVKVRLILRVDEGEEISHVMDELDYSFSDTTGKAQVDDTEILDYDITDSK
jgi:hypothetical protein